MPELPEVETTCRGIEPHVLNKPIARTIVRDARLRWPVPDDLAQCLIGGEFLKVERRAKYIVLHHHRGFLLAHLGMTGSMRIVAANEPVKTHDHVDICFEDESILRYHDPRRFGSIHWISGQELAHPLLDTLGPEPLGDDFSGQTLYARSRGKAQAVKLFIMDAKVVVGVGNIYANEALFAAGIDPRRAAGRISLARYQLLADHIKRILAYAIARGGTTLRDFVGGDGKPGYFKQELNVYGRGGLPCVRCQKTLTEVRLGQRTTVFCVKCQS
ncbi:MAG: bifunctional DNA-formamidopyrimidine glycosylase/DNA-(apurinic or apyrimidinic site) lyase [Halieaceae bacterium]|nr:bifunctional DNA-formamidopyrimidine glycosylase/DNA-(apurinic or apyrimidinic site) lyase [Halieaceae bacterium]